jgi:plasmid stabilization system protein ParE
MRRALHVELPAVEELGEAAAWYESKRPGLGAEFLEALERAMPRVLEMPASFPQILARPPVRRALVDRFPYAVVFMERGDEIHVLAYAHAKRRPLYWAPRAAIPRE